MEPTTSGETVSPAPRVIPYWHTAVLLVVLMGLSAVNVGRAHAAARSTHAQLLTYLATIAYEWLLTAFIWWGLRRSGGTLRELIGGRWRDVDDVLCDIALAGATWFAASIALVAAAFAMGMGHAGEVEKTRRTLEFLVPRGTLEMVVWVCLSATAGFCEEILFRGYLQKQFTRLLRSRWVALVVVSILFGLAHGYEGWQRMVLIALLGLAFGIVSLARNTLRPAMIAHAAHDTISGLVLRGLNSLL